MCVNLESTSGDDKVKLDIISAETNRHVIDFIDKHGGWVCLDDCIVNNNIPSMDELYSMFDVNLIFVDGIKALPAFQFLDGKFDLDILHVNSILSKRGLSMSAAITFWMRPRMEFMNKTPIQYLNLTYNGKGIRMSDIMELAKTVGSMGY